MSERELEQMADDLWQWLEAAAAEFVAGGASEANAWRWTLQLLERYEQLLRVAEQRIRRRMDAAADRKAAQP